MFPRPFKGKRYNKKKPDKWTGLPDMGTVIQGTRFIAFKTPLRNELFTEHDNPATNFTPSKLLSDLPNLRFVIDLTNTDKYYDGLVEFKAKGIGYEKLNCMGSGVLPKEAVVRRFQEIVDRFRRMDNGNGLIGVHCTHGRNRTAYMICRYMTDRLGMSGAVAIERFEAARGCTIERQAYINYILAAAR